MPRAAVELGAAEHVLELSAIGAFLTQAVKGGASPATHARAAAPLPASSTRKSSESLPQVVSPARDKKTVLVVDDEATAMEATRQALERAGYEVPTLDNPLMLARTLRRNVVDLVVLEPELKTMKGAVVVQTLRTHGLTVPFFLLSSVDELTLNQRVRECQAAGSIRKGDPAGLMRAVGRLLR
jgi:PleD family two-component response regulator